MEKLETKNSSNETYPNSYIQISGGGLGCVAGIVEPVGKGGWWGWSQWGPRLCSRSCTEVSPAASRVVWSRDSCLQRGDSRVPGVTLAPLAPESLPLRMELPPQLGLRV